MPPQSGPYAFALAAVPAALTAVSILAFGVRVILRRANRVTSAFLAMSVAVSVWLLAFAAMYLATDAALALAWARKAYLGVPFVAASVYWFTVEILRIEERRHGYTIVAWTLAGCFSAVGATTDSLVPRVERFAWGFYPRYDPLTGALFLLFFFGFLLGAVAELLGAFGTMKGDERKRTRLLILGFAAAYLGSVDFLPKFGIPVYPFGYAGILAFVAIAAWTIRRYDLVPITPSVAAPDIIGAMADALFVCGRDGRVEFANTAAANLLGYREEDLAGRHVDDLVPGAGLSSRLAGGGVAPFEQLFRTRGGEAVELTLSIAPVSAGDAVRGTVIIGRDTRERKRAEHETMEALRSARESEGRYRLLFEQNAAGVCVTRMDGVIVDCNGTFCSLIGHPRAWLVGRRLEELYANPSEAGELRALLGSVGSLNSVEIELRRSDGASLWVLENLAVTGEGDAATVHATIVDISDRKRAEDQIEFHAYHDVLTDLPNRKLFTDRLRQALIRSSRSGRPVGTMFVDIDHFKVINDTLGHTAGDELLLEMSRRLRRCVREDDTVARLGGDEFTIVLELRHPDDAVVIADKILDAIRAPLSVADKALSVTASIGIALYPSDGTDAEALLQNADSAMYRAKEAGRNNYQLFAEWPRRPLRDH